MPAEVPRAGFIQQLTQPDWRGFRFNEGGSAKQSSRRKRRIGNAVAIATIASVLLACNGQYAGMYSHFQPYGGADDIYINIGQNGCPSTLEYPPFGTLHLVYDRSSGKGECTDPPSPYPYRNRFSLPPTPSRR